MFEICPLASVLSKCLVLIHVLEIRVEIISRKPAAEDRYFVF